MENPDQASDNAIPRRREALCYVLDAQADRQGKDAEDDQQPNEGTTEDVARVVRACDDSGRAQGQAGRHQANDPLEDTRRLSARQASKSMSVSPAAVSANAAASNNGPSSGGGAT